MKGRGHRTKLSNEKGACGESRRGPFLFWKRGELVDIEGGAEEGDGEVGEMRRVLIELEPADDAMLAEVVADLCVVDFEVLGQLRAERGFSFGARAASGASRASELAGADA